MGNLRFGYQIASVLPSGIDSGNELRAAARDAEAAGFDVIHTADHVGTGWAPLAPLVAAAEATETLRLCPLVLNNDFYHPVNLAREAAAIDRLSGGRFELGLGAGHAFTEYAAIGLRFDPAAVRKARLAEAVEILRGLLDGQTVTYAGAHYQVDGVSVQPAVQERLPLLVGVNGRAALTHTARHADIVALTGLGRTLEDGHQHEVRWEADRLDKTVALVRAESADRNSPVRLQALVQAVVITNDRRAEAANWASRLEITVDDALATPFLAFGTHADIAEHLQECRQRWGIDYFSVRTIADFAPVVELLRS
jgi:probable F420-dependent oxidoreductase